MKQFVSFFLHHICNPKPLCNKACSPAVLRCHQEMYSIVVCAFFGGLQGTCCQILAVCSSPEASDLKLQRCAMTTHAGEILWWRSS